MVRKYTQTLFLAWFPFIRSSFLDAPADHRGFLIQSVINMRMVQGAENIHHAGRKSRFFIALDWSGMYGAEGWKP